MAVEPVYGPLPDDWKVTTLGRACAEGGGDIQTGPFGSQLHASDYVAAGVPSIMPQNIGDNRVVPEGIARIKLEDAERLKRYRVRLGDIIYSRRGDVERRSLIRAEEDGWLCGTGCLRVRLGQGVVDPLYCSYYLGHPNVRAWIVRHAIGATMPNLNTSILSALPLVVPPLSEQRAIAGILSALEDKIELNRCMNETLEAMARAIFTSWFVDFDPVRAKMEGRQPFGMGADTAALFPDSFEDSPLGRIPGGWQVKPVGDLVRVVGGGTPSTKESSYWEGGRIHWVTPKDLSRLSNPVLLDTERKITEEGLTQIGSGLLPKGTVLLSSRAPIGYLAISQVPVAVNQGFIAMVCDKEVPNYYMLHWAWSNIDTIKGRANGTTFQEISKTNFRPIQVIVPSQPIMQAFSEQAELLHAQTVNNLKENHTLVAIRDALLPWLLAGTTRVVGVEDADDSVQ